MVNQVKKTDVSISNCQEAKVELDFWEQNQVITQHIGWYTLEQDGDNPLNLRIFWWICRIIEGYTTTHYTHIATSPIVSTLLNILYIREIL